MAARTGVTPIASAATALAPIEDPAVEAAVWRIRDGRAPVSRNDALLVLRAHKALFAERFEVERLALFGSVARDEANSESDVDVLARFRGPLTTRGWFGLEFYLEDLLGRKIDLVEESALREEFRPYAESEKIVV